uniref:Putative ml domain protein n=1 Tax=Aedes albopictus TaxID=7160 RepID=A0A023EGU7_AEDAL|nr:mite group 2 allergen Lep d 2-like [Aedes albopictus]
MEVKLTLLVVSLLVSAVLGQLEVQKCKKGAIPNKLEIEGCTKAPCQIVNGQNLRFKAEFTNPKATKTLTAKVIARVAGLIIPYELPAEHRDGCKKLTNAKCPLSDNQSVEAAGDVPVDSPISNVKANIEFQLHADSGIAVCFKIDAKIVK